MKKRLSLIGLVTFLVLSLSGCGVAEICAQLDKNLAGTTDKAERQKIEVHKAQIGCGSGKY